MRRIAALVIGTCALLGALAVPAGAATPSVPSVRAGGTDFCTVWQILTNTCPYLHN
ncbi:hypothetical protein [Streptomyces sp. CBMA123]|uniref:hypothetical protein n=1 Tax=Streptomyces sp. CBMA123 TaxID=1896313 RepID=UPI001661DE05|nr:hypothetical protein [Streptomyces sp. CBMA123]